MVVNDNDDDDDVNDIDSDFLLIFHSLLRNMSGGVESYSHMMIFIVFS